MLNATKMSALCALPAAVLLASCSTPVTVDPVPAPTYMPTVTAPEPTATSTAAQSTPAASPTPTVPAPSATPNTTPSSPAVVAADPMTVCEDVFYDTDLDSAAAIIGFDLPAEGFTDTVAVIHGEDLPVTGMLCTWGPITVTLRETSTAADAAELFTAFDAYRFSAQNMEVSAVVAGLAGKNVVTITFDSDVVDRNEARIRAQLDTMLEVALAQPYTFD